ncbi:MAG TPA: HPr family phosphocarrier protein [Arenimonas sp.]|nr:HPr family phosphocarrier protein [Arenimonas sp.]
MLERELTIRNRLGLHARASAKLVQLLSGFSAQAVLIGRNNREVNAKSIMGVLLLAGVPGSTVRLRLDGADEAEAMAAAVDLFERRFDEEGETHASPAHPAGSG